MDEINCPHCGSDRTRVIASRETNNSTTTDRVRCCYKCHKTFTTRERVELETEEMGNEISSWS